MKKSEEKLKAFFEKEDRAREESLKLCREIGRLAADSIKKIHQRHYDKAEAEIKEAIKLLEKTRKLLKPFPEIMYAGFLHSSEKELVEAIVTLSIIRDKNIPEPERYNFDYKSYLHGLCESTGEIRRHILDEIRKGKIDDCEKMLNIMDEIYFFLLNFQFTDAITRSLRRQVDYVRGILEKTRSEVTMAKLHLGLKGIMT
ncbi:MAG: translin family protein [Candidatus Omnitrophica bacterium]|nr:translin family protein [Candidatus Omnitrophota bacterium]